jgi:hypothetical protein
MAESHREEIAKLEALYASNPGGRVFVHLAEAYRKAGEHDRARRILNEGLERHSDSASAYVVLGRVLADAGEDNEAEAAFRRVLDLDGGNLVALRWLGDLARKNGRLGDARSHYRDLLARNPHNTEIQDLLSSVEATAAGEAVDGQTPATVAPGFTDESDDDEPEFGIVELDDLPGDLGAFAGIAPPRDQSIQETSLEEELGIVGAFDEPDEIEPFQLEDLESQITEEPLDEHVLEESLHVETFGAASQDEEPAEPDLPVVISDLNVPEEPLGDDYMAGSIDLSGFQEPEETEEPDTQPIDLGGLEQAEEFEAPVYAGDLPEYPDSDTPDDTGFDGPASPDTPQEWAASAEPELEEVQFPGEGTEDTPAETLLEPIETETAQEPATFSPEPPETLWDEPPFEPETYEPEETGFASVPEDEFATDTGVVEADRAFEPAAYTETYGAGTSSAEPEYAPSEPAEPFVSVDPLQAAASEQQEAEPITEEQWAETAAADAVPLEGIESAYSDVLGGSAAEVDEESDGLVTETMAELYRAQGFADRAADVYRTLLRRRPHDERLRARLQELEDSLAIPHVESVFEEDESGEVWLRGVGTTWAGSTPIAQEPETPYAWTGTQEEAPAGEPVGSFLRTLVQWRPTTLSAAPPRAAAEPEPLLLEQHDEVRPAPETESWTAPAQPAAPEAWSPPAQAPSAGGPWGVTSSPPSAPEPWAPVTPQAADPWSTPPAAHPPAADPWDTPAAPPARSPAAPDQWAPPAAEPWGGPASAPAQPEPWAETAAPTQPSAPEPWGSPAVRPPTPAPDNRNTSPVEAAFDEWFSPGTDIPAQQSTAPAPSAEPAAPPASPASDAEDEDLEMFRSWLQSLKK